MYFFRFKRIIHICCKIFVKDNKKPIEEVRCLSRSGHYVSVYIYYNKERYPGEPESKKMKKWFFFRLLAKVRLLIWF